ncbi:MAG: hypothetical protein WCF82_12860, partial [Microcoleus sp.]
SGQFGTSSTNTTNKSEKKWGLDNKRDCFPLSFTKKHYLASSDGKENELLARWFRGAVGCGSCQENVAR